jgi:DNA-binding transcriptional LysR family regulator
VSRSAVSHSIRNLEDAVGVRLVNRTTRSVAPTEAGRQLAEKLRPVLLDLDAALDTLSESRAIPSGSLRINTSKGGLRVLLRDIVPRFLRDFPDVELDLHSEGRLVDIVAEGFDAGIRLREAVPLDMVAISIEPRLRFLAVAAPAYLKEAGTPSVPDDLHRHRCIRQRLPSGKRYAWEFLVRGEEIRIEPPGSLTLDDNDAMAKAAERGLGIAYLPETFVAHALERKALMPVLEQWAPVSDLVLYYPLGRHLPPALRAFIDTVKSSVR